MPPLISPLTPDRPILVIDGFNCFLRFFFASQEINSKSEPVGGVVGFMRFLDNIVGLFCPAKVYVVWEQGGPSPRRKHISKDYKANRAKIKEMKKIQNGSDSMRDTLALDDETRIQQLTMLAAILKTTPVCQIYLPETECDDIVAYLAKDLFRNSTARKVIVSNDKDFYQLLDDPMINIYDPATKRIIDDKEVMTKFGISARNFCMAKSISGDDSDNVSGIPGAGFKTAVKRFPKLASIDEDVTIATLLEEAKIGKAATKKPPMIYEDVLNNEELLRRNWSLMYLNSSNLSASQIAKVNYIVENHIPNMDKLALIKTIIGYGINSTIDYDRFCSQLRNYLR